MRRSMVVGLVVASLAAVGGANADVSPERPDAEPPVYEQSVYEQSVEWGLRFFFTREQLEAWLLARGVDYETWAERHPEAAARLEKREARTSPPIQTSPREQAGGLPYPVPLLALAAFGAGLLAMASVPGALVHARLGFLARRRPELAASGLIALVSVGVAVALT